MIVTARDHRWNRFITLGTFNSKTFRTKLKIFVFFLCAITILIKNFNKYLIISMYADWYFIFKFIIVEHT